MENNQSVDQWLAGIPCAAPSPLYLKQGSQGQSLMLEAFQKEENAGGVGQLLSSPACACVGLHIITLCKTIMCIRGRN